MEGDKMTDYRLAELFEDQLNIVDSHPQTATDSMWELFQSNKYCDVTFVVGSSDTKITAHKLVLISRSPVFEVMFAERWNSQGKADAAFTEDTDPDLFKIFLEYLYTDKFDPNMVDALFLLPLADKYNVAPLLKKCEDFISTNITVEDSILAFQLARQHSLKELMEKAGTLMASNFEELMNNSGLNVMDTETLIHLIKRNDIHMPEIDIFEKVLVWAKVQASRSSQNIQEVLPEIIPYIRFPLMSPQEFALRVVTTNILPKDAVIKLFQYLSMDAVSRSIIKYTLSYPWRFRDDDGVSLLKLYQPWPDKDPKKLLLSDGDYYWEKNLVETINFTYTCKKASTGKTYSARLLQLTVEIPKYVSSTNTDLYSGVTNYPVTVLIMAARRSNSTYILFNKTLNLEHGVLTNLPITSVEFWDGHSYTLEVKFQDKVLLQRGGRGLLSPRELDDFTNTFIPEFLKRNVKMGTIELSNIRFSCNTPGYSRVLHAVRGLKIDLS